MASAEKSKEQILKAAQVRFLQYGFNGFHTFKEMESFAKEIVHLLVWGLGR